MEIEILDLKEKVENMWKTIYPVGSIYMSVNITHPNVLFGGEWEVIQGKFLLSVDPADETGHWDAPERTGGSSEITLTQDQMPKNNQIYDLPKLYYGQSGSGSVYGQETQTTQLVQNTTRMTGEGAPINIMPPFYTVYMWKRIS